MPRGRRAEDRIMLEMALVGYQSQKEKIEERIKEIPQRGGARQDRRRTKEALGGASQAQGARKIASQAEVTTFQVKIPPEAGHDVIHLAFGCNDTGFKEDSSITNGLREQSIVGDQNFCLG